MSRVVLDLHGARAPRGVDIDALESFLANFRTAVREYARARDTARLQRAPGMEETASFTVNGRLHMVETDQPNRRVGRLDVPTLKSSTTKG